MSGRSKHQQVMLLPAIDKMEQYALSVIEKLPAHYHESLKQLHIKIENFADGETLENLKIQDKYDLLGLYRGIPVHTKKKSSSSDVDMIYLYRCPLVKYALEHKEEVESIIHYVLLHEISHHFGCESEEISLSLS
jgi:predicted Zn-dependent protease with MMP-like domain